MTENAVPASNVSDTSATATSTLANRTTKDKRSSSRGPPRTSRRIAKQEDVEPQAADMPRAKVVKKEKKQMKSQPKKHLDDPDRETVITESGLVLHPNGTIFKFFINSDHIYLLAEPAGEPYYIARIMEFIYADAHRPEFMDLPVSSTTGKQVKTIRVNWFYRPQDISHKTQPDSRCLYATMHSDVNPLSTVRGKCTIRHRAEIPNREFEEYKRGENNFWFSRLHDRYIQRSYDVVPVGEVTNVPDRVGEVLREKWKYVVVENGAKKELCMEPRRCTKCGEWCRRYPI